MATDFPFFDEQPGPEIREKLNELFALWEGAIGNIIKGDKGWSPLIRAVTSGDKVALQLYDWAGGEGPKPTQTGYLGAAGYVATIADAIDFRGPVGATGPANTLSIGTVETGAAGAAAVATITGTPPNQTLNLTLPRGATGAPNTLAIGTVATGAPGAAASAEITGTAPNQTLNLSLPRGATGNTGPANSLTIGTVTTNAAGAAATASVTGTAPNQTLNLGLPRGATGNTGLTPAITVGTVTTGAPGTSVIVTVTGTDAAPVFNFTIPAGANGTGTGDVNGPSTAVDGQLTQFNGTTGKLVKALALTGMLKFANGVPSVATAGTDYLAGPTSLLSGTDFDTIRTPGEYWVNTNAIAATCLNLPVPIGGALSVQVAGGGIGVGAIQTYTTHDPANRKIYQRSIAFSGGAWTAWGRIYTTVDRPSQLVGSVSTGSPGSTGRSATPVATFQAQANVTGAITFTAPAASADVMYLFSVKGREYQPAQIIEEVLSTHNSLVDGPWVALKRTSQSTRGFFVRMCYDSAGRPTLVLGDPTTVWSSPHIALELVMISQAGANEANLTGWTTALVTDFSSYTNLSANTNAAVTYGVANSASSATSAGTASVVNAQPMSSGQNLDVFVTNADYYVQTDAIAATIVNIPEPVAGALKIQVSTQTGGIQTYTTYFTGSARRIYQRARHAGVWGAWSRIYTTNDPPPGGMLKLSYVSRGTLRTTEGEFAMVDMLGLFQFEAASTEADDDESCFATATGRWLLKCPSFDLIEAWNLPRNAMLGGRVITGVINQTVATVAANITVGVTGSIPGVEPGDTIIGTPPGALGNTAASSSYISTYAYCNIAGTVVIALSNSSAAAITLNPKVVGNWAITVVKAN